MAAYPPHPEPHIYLSTGGTMYIDDATAMTHTRCLPDGALTSVVNVAKVGRIPYTSTELGLDGPMRTEMIERTEDTDPS